MLRIRQKRTLKGLTFAKPHTQASSSKTGAPTTNPTEQAPAQPKSNMPQKLTKAPRDAAATAKRASQQPSDPARKVSNHQRRLASLFMALMASSPIAIEADTETVEAAQKASIAPKAQPDTMRRRKISTVRVQEIRATRWKRFRHELSLKTRRKGKARKWEEVELDDLVQLRGEERRCMA